MKVVGKIEASPKTLPVCMPYQGADIPPASKCHITGYGETKNTGFPDALKVAEVSYIKKAQCLRLGAKYRRLLTENMICAGVLAGGTDSCQVSQGD